ncbi:hypothetical protein [Marinobacterium lutimaris]|uniref:Uncharacterized protein n=1 Tax=Marinobacterium lutimaris TaxID=568106 RepID=A0A1H6BEU8_9GAMM|nr:hypothetical protein [Marinobacterium lutimaris]SEG59301.1 hypothetical protein SAMN05444390_102618 [Marinobacterium lutimaris]
MTTQFPILKLPKRFEALEREATSTGTDISQIVQRVDSAAARVETLVRQVRDGGLGRFELFLGKSGSGKTTFFRTLQQFFDGIRIEAVGNTVPLSDLSQHIRERRYGGDKEITVYVLYDRDNEKVTYDEAKDFFESLRVLFREDYGQVVIAWPITDKNAVDTLSKAAWEIGRDSIVDVISKGIYAFEGVPRDAYYEIGDLTTRNLAPGQTLETFGLTKEVTRSLISESETIAEFYSRLEAKSTEINDTYKDILKEKVIPRVWILVGGDVSQDLNLTVSTLTQGTEKQIDIDRVLKFLDDPSNGSAYLKDWQQRRQQVAFIMRRLDVRLFELPPNAGLAAIRLYGDDIAKAPLNLKSTNKTTGLEAISNTAFMRIILSSGQARNATLRPTDDQTANEYRRVQVNAGKDDKRFNRALAGAIAEILQSSEISGTVTPEKKLKDGNLKPDIFIELEGGEVFCLEPTWRTTGTEIAGEIDKKQNTLSVGHIQKYVLEKVLEYAKELGM